MNDTSYISIRVMTLIACLAAASGGAGATGDGNVRAADGSGAWRRWAVVAAPQLAASADLITAAFTKAGWEVTERDALPGVAREAALAASEGHSLGLALAQMRADGVVIVRYATSGSLALRLADCVSGAVLVEEELPADTAPDAVANRATCLAGLVARVYLTGVRRVAAVPTFACADFVPDDGRLAQALTRAARDAVAGLPGTVLVDAEDAALLRREATLQPGSAPPAPVLLLKGTYRLGEGLVHTQVVVRVDVNRGRATPVAVERSLPVQEAARSMGATLAACLPVIAEAATNESASVRAAWLAARAREFRDAGAWGEAAQLAEAALLLQPDAYDLRREVLDLYGAGMAKQYSDAAWYAVLEHLELLARRGDMEAGEFARALDKLRALRRRQMRASATPPEAQLAAEWDLINAVTPALWRSVAAHEPTNAEAFAAWAEASIALVKPLCAASMTNDALAERSVQFAFEMLSPEAGPQPAVAEGVIRSGLGPWLAANGYPDGASCRLWSALRARDTALARAYTSWADVCARMARHGDDPKAFRAAVAAMRLARGALTQSGVNVQAVEWFSNSTEAAVASRLEEADRQDEVAAGRGVHVVPFVLRVVDPLAPTGGLVSSESGDILIAGNVKRPGDSAFRHVGDANPRRYVRHVDHYRVCGVVNAGDQEYLWGPCGLFTCNTNGTACWAYQIPDGTVRSAASDGPVVWLAVKGEGLRCVTSDGRVVRTIGTADGLPPCERALCVDVASSNVLWAAGAFGDPCRTWACRIRLQGVRPDVERVLEITRLSGNPLTDAGSAGADRVPAFEPIDIIAAGTAAAREQWAWIQRAGAMDCAGDFVLLSAEARTVGDWAGAHVSFMGGKGAWQGNLYGLDHDIRSVQWSIGNERNLVTQEIDLSALGDAETTMYIGGAGMHVGYAPLQNMAFSERASYSCMSQHLIIVRRDLKAESLPLDTTLRPSQYLFSTRTLGLYMLYENNTRLGGPWGIGVRLILPEAAKSL